MEQYGGCIIFGRICRVDDLANLKSCPEKPNKKSGTGETKISLNIKGVIRGSTGGKESAEKTKDNAKTSNTEEESKLLLNVDDSAKENDEKIKIDTPDNDHISKEVTHLLDENLTKEQQNNKPAKKEIIRPENEKTSKADACRKPKNDDEEIKNDTPDNDNISKEVTHLLDEKLTKENPNSKPSTKESKRSSSKFEFPFQKRSSEKHKGTVEIEAAATNSDMTMGEGNGMSGDISIKEKQNNKPTKENIKLSDNENTSKADAFEKTDEHRPRPDMDTFSSSTPVV
uniref:Uncharacterized protein n=1 Tax=Magallana gigas TaxID=29159 RepID=K1QKS7_MAGGI